MSTQTRVSDEEMRFFQFRARQLFLLRREDHQWREFCRNSACECCACLPVNGLKVTREVAVQAAPKKPLHAFGSVQVSLKGRNVQSTTSVQSRTLPEALNVIKTKLEQIDLALSRGAMPAREEKPVNQICPEMKLPRSIIPVELIQDSTNAKRLGLIQSSLKQSLQRLQSSAAWKNPRPPLHNTKKKSSGFFLPHELQRQRTLARNAYLASLAKSKNNPQPSSSTIKEKNSSKLVGAREKAQGPKAIPKTRNKNNLLLQKEEKQEENLVASSKVTEIKDENIELAVEGIIDDLMGETVLLLNKFKQKQSGESHNAKHPTQDGKEAPSKVLPFKDSVEEQNIKLQPLKNWAKIREGLIHFKRIPEEKSSIQTPKPSLLENLNAHEKPPQHLQNLPQSRLGEKRLMIDPETSQEIVRHRREYGKYLERISRTKKANFDPWTLANMISEFLLDECIDEVSKGLVGVPGSVISDLYDQEFLECIL